MRFILFLGFFVSIIGKSSAVFSQPSLDTNIQDTLLFTSNDAERKGVKQPFNGILNPRIHYLVSTMNPPIKQGWDNEQVFGKNNNNLQGLKDTIWLCINENDDNPFEADFHLPLSKVVVTSRYGPRSGRYHNGIDLGLKIGDTIYAMFSGKVRYAKYNDGGFGNLVILRHYNGLETFYAHMSKFLVDPNEEVRVGQPIGLGGNTGRSTGPHLHLEVRFYEGAINPEEIINFDKKFLKKENLFVHKGLFRPGAKPTDLIPVVTQAQLAQFMPEKEEDAVVEPKKPEVKKPEDKKQETKKPDPKKVDPKKVEPKKVEPKKVDPKKVDPKKVGPKKPDPIVKPKVPVEQKKYHQIKPGENLTKIAAKYHTTVSELCKLNGIKSTEILKVGKSLRIK
ncbi:MAG: peptidoglycan DD-metalloendopeptidase family protein [Flavobacteriales bacterium]